MDTSTETLNSNMAKEDRKKLNQCNLCDHASYEAGNLRRHLKTHSGDKLNANNVTMRPAKQTV